MNGDARSYSVSFLVSGPSIILLSRRTGVVTASISIKVYTITAENKEFSFLFATVFLELL